MGCQCKVGKEIDYLHKKYGEKLPEQKKTNIRGSVLAHMENLVIMICVIPLAPFMLAFALGKLISGKVIHLDKAFKLGKDERQQQII